MTIWTALKSGLSPKGGSASGGAPVGWVWGMITLRRVALVLFILVLAGALFAYAPIAPFSTTGSVFVSSPEVYTRERLVNDRYDEDYWYRTNLVALDKSTDIVSGSETRAFQANVGLSAPAPGTGSANGDKPKAADSTASSDLLSASAVPFDIAFKVKSAVRDSIRQLILENMLDDRHDLTGNSIYGLKFDTTVIPGDNTHGRASVQISASIPHPFPSTSDDSNSLPEVAGLVFGSKALLLSKSSSQTIRDSYTLYQDWLGSVLARMNNYANRAYAEKIANSKNGESCGPETVVQQTRDVTLNALASVLGIRLDPATLDAAVAAIPKAKQGTPPLSLPLPRPWPEFLDISRLGGDTCGNPVSFKVVELLDYAYLFDRTHNAAIPDWAGSNYVDIGIKDPHWLVAFLKNTTTNNAGGTLSSYGISSQMISLAEQNGKLFPTCYDESPKPDCERQAYVLPVPSGFFNFVAEASKSDAYVYAVFPKSESQAFLSNVSTDLSTTGTAGGGAGILNGLLQYDQKLRGVNTQDVLVGYGDGQGGYSAKGAAGDKVKFGWVVGPVTSSMQGSELVLLSVPAWSDELTLTVSVGWLDRAGNHQASQPPFLMKIKLPPDYEAFDTFMAGAQARPEPRILDEFMHDLSPLEACHPAALLIPGYRLWRSTTVTLGSQQANQIVVLPNMQGIVARFDRVDVPAGEASARIRVWTSEGEASAAKPVTINVTPDELASGDCPGAGAPPRPNPIKPPLFSAFASLLGQVEQRVFKVQ